MPTGNVQSLYPNGRPRVPACYTSPREKDLGLEDLTVASRERHSLSDTETGTYLRRIIDTLDPNVLLVSGASVTSGAIYLLAVGELGILYYIVVLRYRHSSNARYIHAATIIHTNSYEIPIK